MEVFMLGFMTAAAEQVVALFVASKVVFEEVFGRHNW